MTDRTTDRLAGPSLPSAADEFTEAGPSSGKPGGWLELLSREHLTTTLMLSMGVALFAFNGFFVSTVLPSAIAEIGGGHLIAWSVSLYLIGSIVAGVTAAQLKQRFGARRVLIVATLVFLVGTLTAAFASTMEQVLLGRLGQGLGEGVVAAICYALIPALYPSRLVPKVFGVEALVWTCASFGGPFAAGWLAESFSWRTAFLINLPFGLVFLLLALLTVQPRDEAAAAFAGVPLSPLVLLSVGLLMILSSGVMAAPLISAVLVVLGLALLVASVRRDRTLPTRLMPEDAFGLSSTVGAGLWLVLLMPVAQATSSVYFVFGLQHGFGFGPLAAGGIGAIMAMSWSLVAVLVAHVGTERARRRAIEAGPLLQCCGMLLGCPWLPTGIAVDSGHGPDRGRRGLRRQLGLSEPDADGGEHACRAGQDFRTHSHPAIGQLCDRGRLCRTCRQQPRARRTVGQCAGAPGIFTDIPDPGRLDDPGHAACTARDTACSGADVECSTKLNEAVEPSLRT